MKFKLLSDLHLEGSSLDSKKIAYDENDNLVDVLILAGDIAVYPDLLERHLYNIPESVKVIYVPGNHEYEVKVFNDVIPSLKEIFNMPNWHIMNNETLVIDDCRFICSTMWSNLKINGDSLYEANYEQAQLVLEQQKTKFRNEDGSLRKWAVEDMLKEHKASHDFLKKEIETPFDGKTIVVTHFAPHFKSVERVHKISGFWVSDMSEIMGEVDVWCHGHIHSTSDYKVGNTQVIANPRGNSLTYDLAQNVAFDKNKVLDLGLSNVKKMKM